MTGSIRALMIGTLVMGTTTSAAAQEIVVTPPKQLAVAAPEPTRPHVGLAGGGVLGTVAADGVRSGWVARIEYELLPALSPPGAVGGYVGFSPGIQLWKAGDDNWGIGLPVAIELGLRVPGLRVGGMIGMEALFIDQVADDTGVGLYAPMAGVRATVDSHGFVLGVDGRVTRRWQIGADDHTQWQLGIAVGYLWESPVRAPVR